MLTSAERNKTVPIWEKYSLTIREASEYFGINEKKLRRIIANKDYDFVLMNGNRAQIKRKMFEKFLDGIAEI